MGSYPVMSKWTRPHIGAKAKGKGRGPKAGGKTIVLGMLQRGGHV